MDPGVLDRRPERLIQSSWSAYPHKKWPLLSKKCVGWRGVGTARKAERATRQTREW